MTRLKIILITVSFSALALIPPAPGKNCADPQTQADMNICAGQDFTTADAALNAAYQALLAKLGPPASGLRDAQRAWLVYRDKECALETASSLGGSIHPMLETQCKTELTKQQTARLKAQLGCQEGDISCGGQ